MSWLFSQALVAEYSAATCWDGAPSAQLNVMPTTHKFWRLGKTMEPSQLSRFGLTCAVLTEDHGAALLTWFLAGFRARTYPPPVLALAYLESAQGFGGRWLESSVKYDLDLSSWRTHRCLWEEALPWSSVTLPNWGMTRSGCVYQHPIAERPISVIASGLWPTPSGCTSGKNHVAGRLDEWGGSGNPFRGTEIASVRCASFEEWMMGWPMGWSALMPLEMDKFHLWQQQHSQFSLGRAPKEAA
nr:hypothetical protein [Thauera sp. 28]